ncbi:hypothetical protein PGUG_03811 [Meyerozyma guilliermondii ATCC 6260]|uniref:Uncharacterized protein n=1 Tax=Meyerozyma guilliermondii (strain ATCC 6260 / CBS 566 / DSM 6381 / JCM 1539 / NBRC 10279 / NRRL Y-324) TaxID=294746 RepID=A5DKL0_PICGU|nr:uncharacterized protein PGUG_03811 [Meyerozyma guilliermondii ATCC 6260]EDK39712.2 hypothetical protein PGUG_03811 [Meyerozyma guilliermondii ATCC 6260]
MVQGSQTGSAKYSGFVAFVLFISYFCKVSVVAIDENNDVKLNRRIFSLGPGNHSPYYSVKRPISNVFDYFFGVVIHYQYSFSIFRQLARNEKISSGIVGCLNLAFPCNCRVSIGHSTHFQLCEFRFNVLVFEEFTRDQIADFHHHFAQKIGFFTGDLIGVAESFGGIRRLGWTIRRLEW